VEYIDGTLGLVIRKPKKSKEPAEPSGQIKANWCRQLKRYCKQQGYNPGWVAHKFREKFGVWPNKYQHLPPAVVVSDEVRGWIQHSNIKRAKAGVING
jgi:hypothetical protein